jgi:hypothetical protein
MVGKYAVKAAVGEFAPKDLHPWKSSYYKDLKFSWLRPIILFKSPIFIARTWVTTVSCWPKAYNAWWSNTSTISPILLIHVALKTHRTLCYAILEIAWWPNTSTSPWDCYEYLQAFSLLQIRMCTHSRFHAGVIILRIYWIIKHFGLQSIRKYKYSILKKNNNSISLLVRRSSLFRYIEKLMYLDHIID